MEKVKTLGKIEKITFRARWDAESKYSPSELQDFLYDFLFVAMRLNVFGRVALVGEYDPHERILRTTYSIDCGRGHQGTVLLETDESTFSEEQLFYGYFWDSENEVWVAEDESHCVFPEYEENIIYENLWRMAGGLVPAFKERVADAFNVRL